MERRYLNGSIVAAMFAVAAALACNSGSTTPSSNAGGHSDTVVASGSGGGGGYNYGSTTYSFSPTPDTISAGTALSFEFEDVTHTVIFDNPSISPDSIPPAQSTTIQRTFPTAGTYAYHCRIHTYMHGTIVVQ